MLQKNRIIQALLCFSILLVFTTCQKDEVIETNTDEEVTQTGPSYNQRYCEVLLVKINPPDISLEAYNTIGCNSCPEEDWIALNTDSLKEEYSSPYARLNGPRYWVLDSISSQTITNSCDFVFGNLATSLVATIPISINDLNINLAYQSVTVERVTVWYYFKGKLAYILEDPSGRCHIMQSYSQKVDINLQLEELESLGNRLNLPSGWSYKSVVLENDLFLESRNGLAEIVTDDLENTYQYTNGICF
jgi:hypothetical protein